MAQRFVVITHIGGALFGALFKPQRAGADGYTIAVFQLVFIMRTAINEYFVGAATKLPINHRAVYQSERAIVTRLDVRVITRSPRVIENHTVVRCAADGARALRWKSIFPLAAACVGDFQECHDKRIDGESA